ncbi:MAG: CDP-alcohol phosphatidyltransferase family protein [Saprospiraceae bacterium]
MTTALLLAFTTKWVFWLLLIAFFSFLLLFYSYKKASNHKNPLFSGNYANQITALRFIISSVTALIVTEIPAFSSFMLFGLAILLDGIDGFLARKYNSASVVGALFDKTVDAYFVLLLSFILVLHYDVPFWFIGIGYLHYGYELVLYGLGWHSLTIPPNPIGKYAAAFLFISLLSPFIFPPYLYFPIICLATILVGYSFARSFFYKFKAASVRV